MITIILKRMNIIIVLTAVGTELYYCMEILHHLHQKKPGQCEDNMQSAISLRQIKAWEVQWVARCMSIAAIMQSWLWNTLCVKKQGTFIALGCWIKTYVRVHLFVSVSGCVCVCCWFICFFIFSFVCVCVWFCIWQMNR